MQQTARTRTFGLRQVSLALDLPVGTSAAATYLTRAAAALGLDSQGSGTRRFFTEGELLTLFVLRAADLQGEMRQHLFERLPDVLEYADADWLGWWAPPDPEEGSIETAATPEGLLALVGDPNYLTVVDLASARRIIHDRITAA